MGNHPKWMLGNASPLGLIEPRVSIPSAGAKPTVPLSGLYISVSGEGLLNSDGSSRQDEIRRCLPGERVRLLPGIDEEGFPRIDVISARDQQVGEIRGVDAALICEQFEAGEHHTAEINGLYGHTGPNRRLVLVVGRSQEYSQSKHRAVWPLFRRFAAIKSR